MLGATCRRSFPSGAMTRGRSARRYGREVLRGAGVENSASIADEGREITGADIGPPTGFDDPATRSYLTIVINNRPGK